MVIRYLVLLFLLALTPVLAGPRLMMFASPPKTGYVGPGDIVAGAQAWYGLRGYTKAYSTGLNPAATIRRASDSTTATINILSSGAFDVATASAFCAATTCYVTTWHDQSGANACSSAPCHATQGTAGAQPALTFNCIGALPCVTGNGSRWLAVSLAGSPQPNTFSVVSIRTAGAGQSDILSGAYGFMYYGASAVGGYFGGLPTVPATDGVTHSIQFIVSAGAGFGYVDGTNTAFGAAGTNGLATSGVNIFAQQGGASPLTGSIMELGYYAIAFSAGQAGTVCHNQRVYWGTTATC